jgi:hypothetical protein
MPKKNTPPVSLAEHCSFGDIQIPDSFGVQNFVKSVNDKVRWNWGPNPFNWIDYFNFRMLEPEYGLLDPTDHFVPGVNVRLRALKSVDNKGVTYKQIVDVRCIKSDWLWLCGLHGLMYLFSNEVIRVEFPIGRRLVSLDHDSKLPTMYGSKQLPYLYRRKGGGFTFDVLSVNDRLRPSDLILSVTTIVG